MHNLHTVFIYVSRGGTDWSCIVHLSQVVEEESKYILQTYGRAPLVLTHGQGARVWDAEGKE